MGERNTGMTRWMRWLLVVAGLGFGLVVLGLSIWRHVYTEVQEQLLPVGESEQVLVERASELAEEIAEQQDYALPYPGILPDHPLYFPKMVRDRVVLVVTRDPVSRSELLLHYANKRMAAADVLIEQGKPELAIETATKAQHYLTTSASVLTEVPDSSDTNELWKQLYAAAVVHEEVMQILKDSAADTVKPNLAKLCDGIGWVRVEAEGRID